MDRPLSSASPAVGLCAPAGAPRPGLARALAAAGLRPHDLCASPARDDDATVAPAPLEALLAWPALPPAPSVAAALAARAHGEGALAQAQRAERPLLWLSSLEVLGAREGTLLESDPQNPPYPWARARGAAAFDLDDEWAALHRIDETTRERQAHADRASARAERLRDAAHARGEPTAGRAFARDLAAAEARDVARETAAALTARAQGWGFVTARGYVHALCEQTLAAAGHPVTFARLGPAGVARDETDAADVASVAAVASGGDEPPFAAALFRAAKDGVVAVSLPDDATLELLPADLQDAAIVDILHAVILGKAPTLVHVSAASQGLTVRRLLDLMGLYLRKRPGSRGGAPAWRGVAVSKPAAGAAALPAQLVPRAARGALRRMQRVLTEVEKQVRLPEQLHALGARLEHQTELLFGPTAVEDPTLLSFYGEQRLRAQALRVLQRQVYGASGAPRCDLSALDWRRYLLDTHFPALEHHIDEAAAPTPAPLRAYDNLLHLLSEVAARYGNAPAMSALVGSAREDLSYAELLARVRATARRLIEAGVAPGDRVLLSGQNSPAWPIAAFGVLFAGAVLVPVDPTLSGPQAKNIAKRARIRLALVDKKARTAFGDHLDETQLDLQLTTVSGPPGGIDADARSPDDLASILFTSGTTGDPKGVMLSHANFSSLIASLGAVFDMGKQDRLLSVLPLHHTFEFSCGLLLPLAAGAHLFYLDELVGERVLYALKEGRITAMVGVPALWQLLERRIRTRVQEADKMTKSAFDLTVKANRWLQDRLDVDAGPLLFRRIHRELGGHLRTLISGGAALPKETFELYTQLGLPLAEGYGLTEAAPVLSVAVGGPGEIAGTVGQAIPGVDLRLDHLDDQGVGEVLARGPNVMQGYFENEGATREVLDDEGWLRTGDLGRFDDEGRLIIVGRAKDVVVTASGENLYLDDVEAQIGSIPGVEELTLVGIPDPKGGERLALVFVPAAATAAPAAKAAIELALRQLPLGSRPSVVRAFAEPALPRTATQKVKRRQVASWLAEALATQAADEAVAAADDAVPVLAVRGAVALVASCDPKEILGSTRLAQDLGFDSLMWVELQSALEPVYGKTDAESLYRCETVAALETHLQNQNLVLSPSDRQAVSRRSGSHDEAARRIRLPALLTRPARQAIGYAQQELYRTLYQTDVEGRAHIPYNQASIVVANHCSHLDMGLVKYALGKYGAALSPLAAKDYFFEGNALKVAFFENFTNLAPIDRESGSGRAFEQAVEVVEQGRVLLIFPEGTRRADGTLGEFKPLVGRLCLQTGVPVLPMHISGTFEALPRGATLPKRARLRVRIGAPLVADQMRAETAALPPVAAARAVTERIRQAVVELAAPFPKAKSAAPDAAANAARGGRR